MANGTILLKMGIDYHKNALFDRMTSLILKKFLNIFASDIQTQLFGKSKQNLTTCEIWPSLMYTV